MRSPTEAPPLLQASATSSAAAGPAVQGIRKRWSFTVSLKAMARSQRREGKRTICPACGETPLWSDNETGVCGYCQANGIPNAAALGPLPARPRCRAECENVPRPCPFLSCRHHLYLDVNASTGSIKFNFPDLEPWEMTESCALDVADRGGVTLEEVGAIINVTRERIRQLECRALQHLKSLPLDQAG